MPILRSSTSSAQWRGGAFYLLFFGGMAVYLPFMNVYFRQLGLSGWEIGLLSALPPAVTMLTSAPLSVLADRRAWHIRMLVAGRRNINFGDMRLWGSIGFAALSIGGGALWQHAGYRPMFIAGALLYLTAIWFALRLERHDRVQRGSHVSFRVIRGDGFLLVIFATTFLAMAAYGMDSTFGGIYMTHLGGTGVYVGLLFGLSAVFELPAMRFTGHSIRRLGGPRTLMLAYGLYAVTYAGFVLARSPNVLLVFCAFRGLAFGLFYAGTVRLINDRTPPQWAATVQGIMNGVGFGLARLLSGPVSGRIFDGDGPAAVYVVSCAAAVLALAVMTCAWLFGVERQADTVDETETLRRERRA